MGNIIISIRYRFGLPGGEWSRGPRFYQPEYMRSAKRDWYIAGHTAIVRARVERVIEVVPLKDEVKQQ